jgi:transposase-like protein
VTEWIHNTPARVAARKLHLNYRTVQLWYDRIRKGVLKDEQNFFFEGPVEVDETYLGTRPAWMPGTAVAGKVIIFGIYDRKTGQVYATVLEESSASGIIPEILKHVAKGAVIYSDGYGAYYHLKRMGYIHRRVLHGHYYSLGSGWHSNSIESFWAYLQHALATRKGLPRAHYKLHVKEVVFRFNNRRNPKLRYLLKRILDS